MANPFASDPSDDPLALFGAEAEAPGTRAAQSVAKDAEPIVPLNPVAEFRSARPRADLPLTSIGGAPSDAAGNVIYPTPSILNKLASSVPGPTPASRDLAVEVVGPPPPAESVSFDRICAVKGLGFVEGVALIQETCNAVTAAGEAARVPELHGLYLTSDGEVILHGPPTGEPPARELARLLHQLVAPNLMPPAGRLFVGRWINSDSLGLTEFASELAYFARPNSQELLSSLHSRCEGVRPPAQVHRLEPRHRPTQVPHPPTAESRIESERLSPFRAWLKFHKPEVFVAVVVLVTASATAIATLWSNPKAAPARPPIQSAESVEENGAPSEQTRERSAPALKPPVGSTRDSKASGSKGTRVGGGSGSSASTRRASVVPTPLGRRRTNAGQPSTAAIESQNAARGVPPEGPLPILPSRKAPDLTIYSAKDTGVEPPRLRSAEIPELLIAGFEKRTNQVELVISERGDVQQARMIGPPQRMPDIMLLSRAKELRFDPAVRNGVPVRYRLILSWNVTP